MKTFILACAVALNASAAFAHISLAPHEHPHETSMLPDALALLLAALLLGAGFVVLRRMRKE